MKLSLVCLLLYLGQCATLYALEEVDQNMTSLDYIPEIIDIIPVLRFWL